MKIRQPAVAGKFYPNDPDTIMKLINDILEVEKKKISRNFTTKQILGGIVPHAGYLYSGYQAIHFFEVLKESQTQFDTFFIINPNHTGLGGEIALDGHDYWNTPMGNVPVDKDFYPLLDFEVNSDAHKHEHSGEVLLPMLQCSLNYEFKIVPITLSNQNPHNAQWIANKIFNANQKLQRKICVIASSDFSHFLSPDEGYRLDQFVIDKILEMDTTGVYHEVTSKNISVCGYGPIMALMEYTKLVSNEPEINLLDRGHSGEVHQSDEVVDYVSILFTKK